MLFSLLFESPIAFFILAGSLLMALSVHEFAHAFLADKLGDPTPRSMGRVTLNPLAHLDPIGTLLILTIGFGWGKPVPYDPFNLRNPKTEAALISFAGPASNLIMAGIAVILYHTVGSTIAPIIGLFIQLNIALALFNLIPIYPLDGFRIVGGLLPDSQIDEWESLTQYGPVLLLAVLLPIVNGRSLASIIISGPISFVTNLLLFVFFSF